ncbi:hypothetical protein SAMN05444920_102519 [Nonomuraea solani]|uniref:Uncharacterized protein n=1 Tax=Nonomuraea solani TaxID=1144553 RepID=A0A1H5Z3K9_9ACTN|nr:hypothetical protein [Nonomuraea solani]SEG30620.1 hypothetical protein SAMN05444920_102519 [Nonomuraea solani]
MTTALSPFEAAVHPFGWWLPAWRLEVAGGEAPEEKGIKAVERFDLDDPDETSDSPLHASWGLPAERAEQAYTFLIETLEAGGDLDRRGRALAGFLAGQLTVDATELLRVQDGPALHLLAGDGDTTWRLSLTPASTTHDVPAGHRIGCLTALLSEFLRINNTDEVTFEVTFGTHDVDLDVADPGAAFRTGWPGDGHWLIAEEGDDEDDDVLWPLDATSLRAALTESERNLVKTARAGTTLWEFDDALPEIPGDELVSWLARDLYATIVTEVAGPSGTLLAYAKHFPLEGVLWGETDSCLLLAGPERTALIYVSG